MNVVRVAATLKIRLPSDIAGEKREVTRGVSAKSVYDDGLDARKRFIRIGLFPRLFFIGFVLFRLPSTTITISSPIHPTAEFDPSDHSHLRYGRTLGRFFERVLGQFQAFDAAERERPQFRHDFLAQPHRVTVLDQRVHRAAGGRLHGVRVQRQVAHAADGQHEVRVRVLHQQTVLLDRHLREPGHVERPQSGERGERTPVNGQPTTVTVAGQLQSHQRFAQVLVAVVRFPNYGLKEKMK